MAHIYKASWSGLYLQVSSSLVSCYEQLMNNSNNLVTHKLTHYTSFVFCPQLTLYSFTYKIYTKGDTVRGLDLFFYFQCWVFYKATACKLPHPFFCGFGAWFSAENLVPPAKASYFSENCENKQHCHRSVQVFSSDLLRYPKSRHVFLSLSCLPSLPGNYKAKEIFRSKKQWGRTRWEHCGWYFNLLKGCSKLAQLEGEKTCCREMGFCLVQDDNGSDKDFESFVLASW